MLNRLLPSSVGALLLCATLLTGQDRQVVAAPDHLLHALELEQGTLQKLDTPVDGVPTFEVTVILGGTQRKLQLHIHDMRSSGYALLVHDQAGLHQAESGPVTTYRGIVDGDPNSVVAASLRNDQLEAVIILGDDSIWGIHPTHRLDQDFPRSSHLIYEADALIAKDAFCGVTAVSQPAPALAPEMTSPLKIVEIALDADRTYWQSNGWSIANTENDAMNLMNVVDAIYQRDVAIQYSITTIIVRTVEVYRGTSSSSLLGEFRQRWNSFHRLVQRDVSHLLFDKGIRSGIIGVAYLGVICNRLQGYAVSATRSSGSLSRRAALTAHELGHNWGSGHCSSGSSDCRIMCANLGSCSGDTSRFGTASQNSITNHKNTRSCLSNPEPVLSSINPFSVTAFQPGEITLTGSNLNSVNTIDVGGRVITSFVAENDTTIRFTPTEALPINFLNRVTVTNTSGTSNFLFLTVVGNHPSVLVAETIVSSLEPLELEAHTDSGWLVLLFASPSDIPSSFPDIVDLAIGDNFTRLISVRTVTAAVDGSHTFAIDLPPGFPLPSTIHWQLVTLSGLSANFPLESSNAVTMTIF